MSRFRTRNDATPDQERTPGTARASLLGRAGEAAAWVISALAWALSYAAQMHLASAHGFGAWEALVWPLTTDLAGLVGMLLALDQSRRGGSSAVAWVIAAASAAVMVAANVGSYVGDGVAMLLHAWPPSIALACWYLLVHVRRMPAADVSQETGDAGEDETPQDADTSRPHGTTRRRKGDATRQRITRLLRHDPNVSSSQASRLLGISRSHAARLLADMRRPHRVADGTS